MENLTKTLDQEAKPLPAEARNVSVYAASPHPFTVESAGERPDSSTARRTTPLVTQPDRDWIYSRRFVPSW